MTIELASDILNLLENSSEESSSDDLDMNIQEPPKEPIIKHELPPEFLSKMNARSDIVTNSYSIFKD